MTRPWQTLETVSTAEGALQLRQRGDDFLITVAGRVLMNSAASRSERELARLACETLRAPAPRVLIGGLGMGFTLRAALDALGPEARVEVAEINPVVVAWCRGPLAPAILDAVSDPRVRIEIEDVAARIRHHAASSPKLDAIVLDLYEGPHDRSDAQRDPFYGRAAIDDARRALAPGGVLAVWSEDPSSAFETRLRTTGFEVRRQRPGRGGRRHVVYLAQSGSGGGSPAPSVRSRSSR